jgi:hypothetical protein
MEIVEANDSFEQMFLGDMYEVFASRQDGLTGAALDRIIPFSELFKSALDTGKDIHEEHYAIKDKVYDISIFTIEDNELIDENGEVINLNECMKAAYGTKTFDVSSTAKEEEILEVEVNTDEDDEE